MRLVGILALGCGALLPSFANSTEPETKTLVKQVVTAAGGEDKLLKLFRIRERLNVSPDPKKKGAERMSVLEPPKYWWVGKRERVKEEKEPATFLVWAWTLGALTDPKSKLEVIPEVTESDKPAFGLRVSGTITPPMDLYFDKAEGRLVRIDWRQDLHRFSEWKEHDAPVEYRGEFRPIPTNVPGIQICEHMPLQARMMDKLAVIRSIESVNEHFDHEIMTGFSQAVNRTAHHPLVGSVISKLRGPSQTGIPPFVNMCRGPYPPNPDSGYLGLAHRPFNPDPRGPGLQNLRLPPAITADRLEDRGRLLASLRPRHGPGRGHGHVG